MGFLVFHLELSCVLLLQAVTISRTTRRGTARRGTNNTDTTDAIYVSKRHMSNEAISLWIFAYMIHGVSFQTQIKPMVAVSDDTTVYFAHRILLATDKYISKPHYIHS